MVAIQLLRLGFFEDFSGERGGQGSILTPSTFIFQEESEKYRHHLLQADFISFFVKVNVKKSKKLIKKVTKNQGYTLSLEDTFFEKSAILGLR